MDILRNDYVEQLYPVPIGEFVINNADFSFLCNIFAHLGSTFASGNENKV